MVCSNKGVIHDFELYSGKILPPDKTVDLGTSSNIVLRLAKAIPTQKTFCFMLITGFHHFHSYVT